MKQLERLLFLQGGRCFFCAEAIPAGEASIEHLVAAANGGLKDDQNCVACCKTVNAALGSLSIKAKLQAILNQRGRFACPASGAADGHGSCITPVHAPPDRVAMVIADLVKRGPSRPRRVATLKNTMNSVFHMTLSESELDELATQLKSLGHIIIEDKKVSYALPAGA